MYVRICSSAEEAARSPVCVVCPAMAAQHAKSNYQKALEKVEEKKRFIHHESGARQHGVAGACVSLFAGAE